MTNDEIVAKLHELEESIGLTDVSVSITDEWVDGLLTSVAATDVILLLTIAYVIRLAIKVAKLEGRMNTN